MQGPVARRCIIRGRVQGVWYRAWTMGEAQKLGLRGWVRNCADGSVEALFAGPGDQVDAMIALCHDGPRAARVASVTALDFSGDIPGDFRQMDDA